VYKKILVPLDSSELAEEALPYAEELAARLASEVTLLYVGKSTEDSQRQMLKDYLKKAVETTRNGIEQNLNKQATTGIKVESVVLIGNPAEQIVDYTNEKDIGLIVMATHGRSGITRWALGSVTDKVMQATKKPMVLIRAKATRPDVRAKGMLKKILVCLDGSTESETVLPYIEELGSKLKAEIVLLQVVPWAYHIYATEEGASHISYTDEEMEPLKASANNYLGKMGKLIENKKITVSCELRIGNEAEEIIKLTSEVNANMVAMSTHGRSGVGRWIFGSIADKIIRQGTIPILLVRVT
jgi:nucleotide-binding universal stress UspA family protein